MAKKYFKVTAPYSDYNGVRNGVKFIKGSGIATAEQAVDLVNVWGYSCPDLNSPPNKSWTKTEIKEELDAAGISYKSGDNKEELLQKFSAGLTIVNEDENKDAAAADETSEEN